MGSKSSLLQYPKGLAVASIQVLKNGQRMVNNLSPKDAREGEEDASSNLMDAAKKLKQVQCVVELKYRHLLTTRAMRSVNHSLKGNEIRSLEVYWK